MSDPIDGNTTQTPPKPIAGTSKRRPSKRFSVVAAEGNPLSMFTAGAKAASAKAVTVRVENTSDARVITASELAVITDKLKTIEDNAEVISHVESVKTEFLFTSDSLIAILDCISSLKTKLTLIENLAQRLTDPKAKQAEIIDMFRFVTDREKVEGILKARAQQLSAGIFRRTDSGGAVPSPVKTQSPGFSQRPAAGRGLSGRGNGSFRSLSASTDSPTSSSAASSLTSPESAASISSVFNSRLEQSVAALSVTEGSSARDINTIEEGEDDEDESSGANKTA